MDQLRLKRVYYSRLDEVYEHNKVSIQHYQEELLRICIRYGIVTKVIYIYIYINFKLHKEVAFIYLLSELQTKKWVAVKLILNILQKRVKYTHNLDL